MLHVIIGISALGGAVALKAGEYAYSYFTSKPATKPRKKNARKPKAEAAAPAVKPKNVRRAATSIVEKAEAATKKVTVSDAKPEPTKVGQGKGSLSEQLANVKLGDNA
jgi:hypothetical protein